MSKSMPPLRALVTFEAAVRCGSFKQAATELHVSAGAVSQQIQRLEEWLGYPLFVRMVRRLKVTDQGMHYFGQIAPALEQIRIASKASKNEASNKVCLSLTQTLASKWLGPRLGDFVRLHPDLQVHINASNQPVDLQQDDIDLAIRHFDGKDPHLESTLLFQDELRAFCTPGYQKSKQLTHPDTLQSATLIVTTTLPYWDIWLDNVAPLKLSERKQIAKLHFDQTLLAIDAAIREQGVVLCSAFLVQDEVAQGRLIDPFDKPLYPEKGYYLVHPKQKGLTCAAQKLKQWILHQFSLN